MTLLSLEHGVTPEKLLGRLQAYGEPFGYAEERDGAIVHDLRPAPGLEETQSSLGRAAFLPHTDAAFLPPAQRPRALALLGINNDARSATLLYRLAEVLAALPSALIDRLAAPSFEQIPPFTFQAKLGSQPLPGHRILTPDPAGGWVVGYSAQGTKGGSDPQALADFESALAAATPLRLVIQPGDLLIFDNLRFLHGREVIVGPRHLQRVYLR
jgi:L-asparagine oxygenase